MSTVHQNPSNPLQTRCSSIRVPAKAMLFGEYAVLRGAPAVTAVLASHSLCLDFELTDSDRSNARVTFDSDFFASPLQISVDDISGLLSESQESEQRNLACYLSGYEQFICDKNLVVKVQQSFSPELGFGSSSALLVAFHLSLYRFFKSELTSIEQLAEDYWQGLYRALILLQRKGSGYDVATQSWAVRHTIERHFSTQIFSFENPAWQQQSFSPSIRQLSLSPGDVSSMGCFVRTGVRSDTRHVLQSTRDLQSSIEFCRAQATWARLFIEQPSAAHAQRLCYDSSRLARACGLLPLSSDVQRFVDRCDELNVAWKTMGAGHGDCLWVLAPRAVVSEIIAQTGAVTMSVSFAFAEGA